ncbi:ABC transporter substrate-binding protein [Brucella anthropi]|uniref:ABC transporter substrate-binding protein n=1 Tax=Brucella anthropi TaxID=529 RepID=UPI002166A7B1|nr:ABC transporter substrate-binding protein [Brucella anthropi]MDG9793483.1 ABC transporter substrate-binding protein [Brucella anthropi]MDH0583270.1 ABC transporter substrate-binding protein [Brucella anthropi]MDH0819884.1 ABC transporter substrate-binding protein [Brucella anthropi]MDH2086591.1 ABC transporter substrate-binding protein [Brucella anthropi]UVV70868.1 ABC transporter substrate-binding protein [Brucella anthropi]
MKLNVTKFRLALILLATTAFCNPAIASKADDTLNAAFTREIATLDTYKESTREGPIVGRLIYDSLLSKDFKTGEFIPELAESYKVDSDTEITFKIRKGVKFHNGDPLTAEDVVFTLNLVSKPDFGAKYDIAVNWIKDAEKVDDDTVKLTMKSPNPLALEMLAGNLPIYSKAYYEKVGTNGMAVKPVGTGPYKVVAVTPGSSLTLERFDDYYKGGQKENPKIKNIVFRILPERNTQYTELMNGTLDWVWQVPKDDALKLENLQNIKIDTAPIMRFAYIQMATNIAHSPLANQLVRKAIAHAINRTEIRDAFQGNDAQIINSACNPVQFGCETDVATYDYNPSKAKELLKEAGFEAGFTLNMVTSGGGSGVPEAVKADLEKVGIKLELHNFQYAAAIEQWRSGKLDLFYDDWGSYGVGDVGLSVANFFKGTGDDVVKDPEVIPLLDKAGKIMDRDERKQLYSKALKLIADKAYWVPLWVQNVKTASSKDLALTVSPDEFVPFYDAEWK